MPSLFIFSVAMILLLFYTLLAFVASKRIKTTTDYFLAGRDLGVLPVTLTLIATQLGGGLLLGTSQEAYQVGLYGILYTVGMSIGFFILAAGLASKLQSFGVSTTAELFETHYHSPALKKVASLISIVTLCGIFIGQIVASKSVITALNIESQVVFVMFWLFVIGYTMLGGLTAVVIMDVLQVLFIIAIFGAVFLYSVLQEPVGLLSSLATAQSNVFKQLHMSSNLIFSTIAMPALFACIEQDLAQRFFAARTRRVATISALLAAVFMIGFSLIPIYFGMKAKLMGIAVAQASPLIPVIAALTNSVVVSLALCAIVAAITSTADSLLCAISSNVSQDFKLRFLHKNPVVRSQIITCFVGLSGLAASYFVPQNIILVLVGSYELSVSCLLIPLIAVYVEKQQHALAAWCALGGGLLGFFIAPVFHTILPQASIPLLISAAGYSIGTGVEKIKGRTNETTKKP